MEWLKIETETYPSISNGLLTYLIANNCPYLANICPTYLPTHYGSECYTFKSLFCLGMQENQGDLNCLIPPSDIQGKKPSCLLFICSLTKNHVLLTLPVENNMHCSLSMLHSSTQRTQPSHSSLGLSCLGHITQHTNVGVRRSGLGCCSGRPKRLRQKLGLLAHCLTLFLTRIKGQVQHHRDTTGLFMVAHLMPGL